MVFAFLNKISTFNATQAATYLSFTILCCCAVCFKTLWVWILTLILRFLVLLIQILHEMFIKFRSVFSYSLCRVRQPQALEPAGRKRMNAKTYGIPLFLRFSVRVEIFMTNVNLHRCRRLLSLLRTFGWWGEESSIPHRIRELSCAKKKKLCIVYRNSQLSAVAGGLLGLFLWQKYKILFSFIFFLRSPIPATDGGRIEIKMLRASARGRARNFCEI